MRSITNYISVANSMTTHICKHQPSDEIVINNCWFQAIAIGTE